MEILSDLHMLVQSSLFTEGTISWKETPPTSFENTTWESMQITTTKQK